MSLNPLSHEFSRFGVRHGFSARLTATGIVALANQFAQERFVARSFRAGRLVVEVADAEARHLVQAEVPQLIDWLNGQLGSKRVQRVQFRLVGSVVE